VLRSKKFPDDKTRMSDKLKTTKEFSRKLRERSHGFLSFEEFTSIAVEGFQRSKW